jgi:hypothetical protein
MNKIEGIEDISDYEGYWNYVNYKIDGYWLDEKLEELYPGNMYKGLVPTLLDSMYREDEKAVVWKRILPDEFETTVCPILMCPDDNDFSCTIIVAEIRNRIGIDKTQEWEAEKVGTEVEWFDKVEPLSFAKYDYMAMLKMFEKQVLEDRLRFDRQAKP